MAPYDYNANETGSILIPTPATLLRTLLGLRSVKSYMVTSRLDTSCCLKASKDNCMILKIIKDDEDLLLHLWVAYKYSTRTGDIFRMYKFTCNDGRLLLRRRVLLACGCLLLVGIRWSLCTAAGFTRTLDHFC